MKNTITVFVTCILLAGCATTKTRLDQIEDRAGRDGRFLAYRKGDTQPFTGKAFDLYPNGKMKEERTYLNGRETGMYRTWHSNGQKQEEIYQVDGVTNGRWLEWHENGQMEIKATAKDGCAVGRFQKWNPDGTIVEDQIYPEGGIPLPSATEEGKQNKGMNGTR